MSLETYHHKRRFERTPEPRGKLERATGDAYVIQKHAASRLHYDFRLELGGVLLSWAVPKGPSLDPGEKRLAMQTEDHPVEYGSFEGTIPKGEYGGGTVMVWDRGTWSPEGDARAAYERGRMTFTLHGEKLKGKWHLIRTRTDERGRSAWVLFKGADDEARRDGKPIVETMPNSVVTQRALDEIAAAADRTWHSNRDVPKITNQDKILYPESGITKGDVAAYYERVSPLLLPHIVDRPLMLVRCPNGIGRCFIQKHEDEHELITIDDHAGLMRLAQAGVLEIHTWGAHARSLEHPDMMVLDLDPDPAVPWKDVVGAARLLRRRLQDIGLEPFVKTTGGKGLHVCCAVDTTWDELKALSRAIADSMVKDDSSRFVATMSKSRRKGKIFIDYLRNARGNTFVAPYSPRARPAAPVAIPLEWDEISARIKPDHFTLRNVRRRLEALEADPWKPLTLRRRAPSPAIGARR